MVVVAQAGQRGPDRGAGGFHVGRVVVGGAGPEEPPQAVLGTAGHDMDMEVRHALAHGVVHGHERARGVERHAERGGEPTGPAKQRVELGGRQLDEGAVMLSGHEEHVPHEQGPDVEEGHAVVVVEHDLRRCRPLDDATEQTGLGLGHPGTLGRLSARRRTIDGIDVPDLVPTYGLDIETDTTIDGLDPEVAAVVAVAVAGADLEVVLDGDETSILRELDALLASLPAGVLVTWNGSAFDLPFLGDRARRRNVELGLRLELDPSIPGHHDPLVGHRGAYRAGWHAHRHLDGYQVFRADVGAALHMSCGLKPLARFVGLPVVEVDRAQIHELTDAEVRSYVASDAHLARALVTRRWATARRAVDAEVPPQPIGS